MNPLELAAAQGLPLELWSLAGDMAYDRGRHLRMLRNRAPDGGLTATALRLVREAISGAPAMLKQNDDKDGQLEIDGALAQPFTVLFVGRLDLHNEGDQVIGADNSDGPQVELTATAGEVRAKVGTSSIVAPSFWTEGQTALITVCFAGAASYLARNGNQPIRGSLAGTGVTDRLYLFCGAETFARISVGEIALFSMALSWGQVRTMYERYFAPRWGI